MHLVDDEEEAPARSFGLCIDDGCFLSPMAQMRIGAELRAMYAGLREEPLPDHLVRLAELLERKCQERIRGH